MLYFNKIENSKFKQNFIKLRQHRKLIKGFKKVNIFTVGDIIKVVFSRKNVFSSFEGICICIKKKKFLSSNTTFILRNVILGIPIEMNFSYFLNRLYYLKLQDYKRKMAYVYKNKLFFLRSKVNKFSIIKI
jgi:ribosomal protein L19